MGSSHSAHVLGEKMVRPAHSTVIGTGILIQTARLIVDPCHRYPANVRELSRRNPRRVCVTEQTPRPSRSVHTDFYSPFRFGFDGTTRGLHARTNRSCESDLFNESVEPLPKTVVCDSLGIVHQKTKIVIIYSPLSRLISRRNTTFSFLSELS